MSTNKRYMVSIFKVDGIEPLGGLGKEEAICEMYALQKNLFDGEIIGFFVGVDSPKAS